MINQNRNKTVSSNTLNMVTVLGVSAVLFKKKKNIWGKEKILCTIFFSWYDYKPRKYK